MPTEGVNPTRATEPEIPPYDRWKIRIRRCLAQRNLEEAARLANQALDEFPDDAQLLELEEQVIQWKQRKIQAYLWMEEGKQLCEDGDFQEGLQVLRSAVSLDEHDPTPRTALINTLLQVATEIVEENWHSAELLAQEAIRMNPANPTARSVLHSIKEWEHASNGLDTVQKEASNRKSDAARSREASVRSAGPDQGPNPGSVRAISPVQPVPPNSRASIKSIHAAPEQKKKDFSAEVHSAPGKRIPSEPRKTEEDAHLISLKSAALEPGHQELVTSPPASTNAGPGTPSAAAKEHVRHRKTPFAMWIWAVAAMAVLLVGGLAVWMAMHGVSAGDMPIQVEIRTIPPGAEVRINGEPQNIAGQVLLSSGTHRVEAFLDGYEPAVLETMFSSQFQGPIELTLQPAKPGLRLSTDFEQGAVFLDNDPAGKLQDGQYAVDSLEPGKHTLKIRSSNSIEAEIPFETFRGDPPILTGPIAAKNLRVILVSHHQGQGEVYTNFGPISATMDGKNLGKVPKSGGLAVDGLSGTSHQLILGEGKQQQKIALDVSPAGGLFVELRSDRNVGSIEIVTNQELFDVIVNGAPGRVSKRKDRYFIYNLEAKPVSLQVSKEGFRSDPPQQQVTVRKGSLTKVTFNFTPIPTTGTLALPGLLPGTRALVDGASYDLNPDGTLEVALKEGEHSVELIRPGYQPKLLRVAVEAGKTLRIERNVVKVEQRLTGKLLLASRTPLGARVFLRQDEIEIPVVGKGVEAPEGDYTLVASASGYRDQSQPVHIAESTPVTMHVNLSAIPQPVHMEGWEDQAAWKPDNGWYTRKGGMFSLYRPSARTGVWQFTARTNGRKLFGSSRITWVMHYVDENNYELFEIDKENLSLRRVVDGKPGPEIKKPHRASLKDETYHLQLEISPGGFGGKVFSGDRWIKLPAFENGQQDFAETRFGLLLPGSNEIWVTDVQFTPME